MMGNPATPRLAIIGGGIAGHAIAYAMQDEMQVTLIDPKTYFEVPMALPRLLVEPDTLPARIAYVDFLQKVTLIQGHAKSMTDSSIDVVSADGDRTVPFDYAVIASGSRYFDPLIKATSPTEAGRSAEIRLANELYRAARTVVIVGGGAVGVETAAELRETIPHLRVILVHSGEKLLEDAPDKLGGWAMRYLVEHGVEFVMGDRVTSPAPASQPLAGIVALASGKEIAADAVIWAVGVTPATEFVARSWPDAVDPKGLLKVDRYLRLTGHPAIFAVGDTTNLPERRMAFVAGSHVESVNKNLKILAAAHGPRAAELVPYKLNPPGKRKGKLMLVTLGRKNGLTALPFGQFRAKFLARLKSEDMLVGRMRKGVGL